MEIVVRRRLEQMVRLCNITLPPLLPQQWLAEKERDVVKDRTKVRDRDKVKDRTAVRTRDVVKDAIRDKVRDKEAENE